MSPADYVTAASTRLQSAGVSHDEAAQSAVVLARWVLGWTTADWLSRSRESAPADFPNRFLPLIERRAHHEPVAYIIGEREFYGRPFKVTRDVLIPRPETEFVVEEGLMALQASKSVGSPAPRDERLESHAVTVLDVGTGSGCLAVTLALECPCARVIATDISAAALDVARDNARQLGAADRIEFRHVADDAGGWSSINLIVANPPYVPETDRASLSPDVIDFEPASALFAGGDGLDVIRVLLPIAAAALVPDGWLVLEIGHGQLSEVQDLIEGTPGLTFHHFRSDLQGIPRVIVARQRISW